MSSFEGYRQNNDSDRTKARGDRRSAKAPPPPSKQPAPYGTSPNTTTVPPTHHAGRSQGDGFAWGGAASGRDRPGQARKAKGPSVPAPANVAPSAGHNFQSLGNMPVRSGGQGGMQALGRPAQSRAPARAVPVTPAAAETAAPSGAPDPAQPATPPVPAEAPAAAASGPSPAGPAQAPTTADDSARAASASSSAAAAAAPSGAGPRETASADVQRSAAAQDAGAAAGAAAPAPSQQQGQRQNRGRGNSNQRLPHRSSGQQGNQHWGSYHSTPQGPQHPGYQAYPSQIPPSYQGYQAYTPIQQVSFGQQPVVFGNMPAQVPVVPFVPTVPAARTYATSYAAASRGTLQPDAAPFVSASSTAATALPYKPYQVKPPPNSAILQPPSSPRSATVAPAQPFFVPSPPWSASSQPPAGPSAASPQKGGAAAQQPPVTLATITPASKGVSGVQAPSTPTKPSGTPPTAAPDLAEAPGAPSGESKAPAAQEAAAEAADGSADASTATPAGDAPADMPTQSCSIAAANEAQQRQQQRAPPVVKTASLLPATAGWGGKRKTPAAAPAAPMPVPVAQPASSSPPPKAASSAASQTPVQPASVKPSVESAPAPQPTPSAQTESDATAAKPGGEPALATKDRASTAGGAEKPAETAEQSPAKPAKAEPPAEAKPAVETGSAPAQELAAASLPAAPAPVAVAAPEPPKARTWATMAKALATETGPTVFRPPPPKPVTPKSATSSGPSSAAGRPRQARGQSESGRSVGRRDASRDAPRDGQRNRGRGEPGHRREDRNQHRVPGDASRDSRDRRAQPREVRPSAPVSTSAQKPSSSAANAPAASQTAGPAAEKAPPAASAAPAASSAPAESAAAASDSTSSTAAPGQPDKEAAPAASASEAASVQSEASESGSKSETAPVAHPEAVPASAAAISANEQAPAAVPKDAETAAPGQAPAAQPKKAAAAEPAKKALSSPVLDAVRRLCGAVDDFSNAPAKRFLPRGLVNTGNLCFMNSILQALMGGQQFCAMLQSLQAAAPAFTASELPTLHAFSALAAEFLQAGAPEAPEPLANGDAGKTAPKEPVYKAKDPPKSNAWARPGSAGANAVTLAARLNQKALLPDMMFPTVNRFNPNNGRPLPTVNGKATTAAAAAAAAATRQQEDAQEFLNFLLDSAHQELLHLRLLHAASLSNPDEEAEGAEGGDDNEEWLTAGRSKKKKAVTRGTTSIQGGTTLASAVFGGALRSEVKAAGAPASATLEPCFVVHLDIHPDAVRSVSDALHAFTSPETISGYKVRDNSEGVTARKVVQLYALPRILVLHLKRFSYGLTGTGKIHKTVHYGDRLRVQPSWVAEGCPDARHRGGADYELIAVVHHLGRTPAAGHYTADVRQPDGKWLHFDDADLSNVPLARVVDDNKAYLLFYQLRE
ncbi:hypothetical protein WJX75_005398 [Coccomyxa subellipsoidea]|uniref:ubiquitinyl hydrolase 1 n=1 Tax=Coccomyxa subellipsoidea TaxID=248742 RepID=A0ABR2Z3R6_9CHLO